MVRKTKTKTKKKFQASLCFNAPSLNRRLLRRLLTRHRLTDGDENNRRLSDDCGHIYKKKINFVIFGRFKRKNPRAVGSNHRILDRNVVVFPDFIE